MSMRTIRTISMLATIAALGFVLSVGHAEDTPDATLKLSGGSVAAGIGYTWGGGTLTYKGKTYEVELSGLSIADVGATKIEASGSVYHLNKLSDFDGNYTAATAGMTIAGGGSATAMQNQNGVVIQIVSTTQGLKFAFASPAMIVCAIPSVTSCFRTAKLPRKTRLFTA